MAVDVCCFDVCYGSAIMAGLRVIDGMKAFGLDAGIGITSGRVWCGVRQCCTDESLVVRTGPRGHSSS